MSGKEKDASCTETVMQRKEMNRWRGNGGSVLSGVGESMNNCLHVIN